MSFGTDAIYHGLYWKPFGAIDGIKSLMDDSSEFRLIKYER